MTRGLHAKRRATEITVLALVVLPVLYRRMELRSAQRHEAESSTPAPVPMTEATGESVRTAKLPDERDSTTSELIYRPSSESLSHASTTSCSAPSSPPNSPPLP